MTPSCVVLEGGMAQGPGQAEGLGLCQPCEVQLRQVQGAALGLQQSQAQVQAG